MEQHHEGVIDSLPHTVRADPASVARLHRFRRMRNEMTCERVGAMTDVEATGFLTLVLGLREQLIAWLQTEHPNLRLTED